MKRIYYFLGIVIFTTFIFHACEIDDICTESVLTPKLIVVFNDAINPDMRKNVENLYVWAEAKDSLYRNVTLDSIILPLDTNTFQTTYLLSKDNVVDTLYLSYNKEDVFVSRSCGYKINFELTNSTHISDNWMQSMQTTTSPQLIKDETAAHLTIYH